MATGFQLIHAKPNRLWSAGLSWFLFVAVVAAYLYVADARHRENPEDRVTPTVTQMAAGMYNAVHAAGRGRRAGGGSGRLAGHAYRAACSGKTRGPHRGDFSTAWCC